MTVKISSIGLKGLEGYRVQVQVQVSKGKESMVIVGLPDASVKESKERVLSAVHTLARERQYERYQEQISNAKVPFEKLLATSPLQEHQLRMIRQVASKQQWNIVFKPLGIDVKTRIISLEYNPFYRYNIRVEVGRYKPSISDTFYRIENSLNTVELL